MARTARGVLAAAIAAAASLSPGLASAAPWAAAPADPAAPLATQFLISLVMMGVGGGFALWESLALARERKRRRAAAARRATASGAARPPA